MLANEMSRDGWSGLVEIISCLGLGGLVLQNSRFLGFYKIHLGIIRSSYG